MALEEVTTADGRTFHVRPLDQSPTLELPDEFTPSRLGRRTLQVVAVLAVAGLVLIFAPGLGQVRDSLSGADPGWVALAIALEAMSCISYVLMFRPIFCPRMPWRTSWEIGLAELGAGSIVPASGAGGLALGAWILSQGGMPAERIAHRSVAFFMIKSSVNFVAVAVLGTIMALGCSTTPGSAKARSASCSTQRRSVGCWSSWVWGFVGVVRGRSPGRGGICTRRPPAYDADKPPHPTRPAAD